MAINKPGAGTDGADWELTCRVWGSETVEPLTAATYLSSSPAAVRMLLTKGLAIDRNARTAISSRRQPSVGIAWIVEKPHEWTSHVRRECERGGEHGHNRSIRWR